MRRFIFTFTCLILLLFCFYQLFLPLYNAKEIVVTLGFHPFDICYNNSSLWDFLKISFIFFYTFSSFIIINSLIIRFKNFEKKNYHTIRITMYIFVLPVMSCRFLKILLKPIQLTLFQQFNQIPI